MRVLAAKIMGTLGLEKVMFEVADPNVFGLVHQELPPGVEMCLWIPATSCGLNVCLRAFGVPPMFGGVF
jgi:hypothetical protein